MFSNRYIVKSKDILLVEFEIITKLVNVFDRELTNTEINIIKIWSENKNLFPKSLKLNNDGIANWISKRKIPKNRAFVEKILATFEGNDDNPFSEALSVVAFTGHSNRIKGLITSPEFTTNGMLKKSWHRNDNGDVVLLKGAKKPYANEGLEPYSEFYAAQVAKAFGINHVKYDLQMYHKELVSSCNMFTSQDIGYIPAYELMSNEFFSGKSIQSVEIQYEIAKIIGIEFFEDMMLFDSIIYNTDRHLGNFGMLINNNTGDIVGPAPIFDNGFSLFNGAMEDDILNLKEYGESLTSAFEMSFDRQSEIYLRKRHIPMIQKLIRFQFQKHPLYNLPDHWIKNIEQHIQNRAKVLMDIIDKEKIKKE